MTISSETRKAGPFNGNGVTTSFPFTFKTFAKADVRVVYTDVLAVEETLVLDSDYTITLNGDQNASPGGTVSYSTLNLGEKLTLIGSVEYTQETDIQNQGGFYPEVIENALDKLTMQTQQIKEEVDRAVKVNVSSENNPDELIGFIAQSVAASSVSASESESSALDSLNSANQAEASALLAEKWANENEDVPVVPGKFSAKHWAAKALATVAGKLSLAGGTLTGLLNLAAGADIASASTVDLTTATGNTVRITGTTAITAFTMNAGQQMELIAVGALPLTYNATTMNINGGVSYTCAAGDRLSVTKDNAGVVRVNVTKQDGTAVVGGGNTITQGNSSVKITDVGTGKQEVTIDGVVIQENTLASRKSTIDGGSTLYPEFKCRAWVNFNGTGTVAIRASGNVSSITDNGTGDYTVNFTNAMPDANYSCIGLNLITGGLRVMNKNSGDASSVRVLSSDASIRQDNSDISVAVFR